MILLVFIRISDLRREEVTITGFLLSGFAALVDFKKILQQKVPIREAWNNGKYPVKRFAPRNSQWLVLQI